MSPKADRPPVMALVKARWVAGFDAVLAGQPLLPGETVVEIGADEAHASDCWEIVTVKKPKNEDSE